MIPNGDAKDKCFPHVCGFTAGNMPDQAERLHSSIKNSQSMLIPNAGHMSPVEEPAAINTAISAVVTSFA